MNKKRLLTFAIVGLMLLLAAGPIVAQSTTQSSSDTTSTTTKKKSARPKTLPSAPANWQWTARRSREAIS